MRGRDGKGGTEVERGVTITALPAALRRQGLLSYCFDYAWFWALVASTLTVRHLRRPYAVVQVNTMPDLLVFSAIVPKLLGSRVIAFLKEPTPELFETLYGRPWLTRTLKHVEQAAIRFADHALTVTEELRQVVHLARRAGRGHLGRSRTATRFRRRSRTATCRAAAPRATGSSCSATARSRSATASTRSSTPHISCATASRGCRSCSPAAAAASTP